MMFRAIPTYESKTWGYLKMCQMDFRLTSMSFYCGQWEEVIEGKVCFEFQNPHVEINIV